jgi:hypothetical protein
MRIWPLLLFVAPALLQAQDTRVRATVDYVAGASIYLSAGEGQGLFAGDTVRVRRLPGSVPGRLVIVTSTRGRSVAQMAGDSFAIARGDTLIVEISAAAQARASAAAAPRDSVRAPAPVAIAPAAARAAAPRSGVRTYGRIGFDINASETTSRWGDTPEQQSRSTYSSQVARFRLTAENLPGNLRFNTNLRAAWLTANAPVAQPLALEVYQASIETELTALPLRLAAGRFYNPYESHSGYFDGLLLRMGRSGLGAGAVVGFEPHRANRAFHGSAAKVSAFVDAHDHTGAVHYDGDLSVHHQAQSWQGDRRDFVGISQRIAIGRVFLTQRAQAGRINSGTVDLWQMQLSAALPITGALQLVGRYARERNALFMAADSISGARVRLSAGLSGAGRVGAGAIEVGSIDNGYGASGRTVTGSVSLPNAAAGIGLSLNGGYWQESSFTSVYATPALERTFGRTRVRAAGSYYRSDFGGSVYEQRGADLMFARRLTRSSDLSVTFSASSGSGATTYRLLLGTWKSF